MSALATGFQLPFNGTLPISQRYGVTGGLDNLPTFKHLGIDYDGVRGTAILAIANGIVVAAETNNDALGNYVIIQHTLPDYTKVFSLYAHLDSLSVRNGDDIHIGNRVGGMGDTGAAEGVHLHHEISYVNKFTDSGEYGKGYDDPNQFRTSSQSTVNPADFINAHPVTIVQTGGSRADILWGLSSSETIRGGGGDDTLFGNLGNDVLEGGSGNDTLNGGSGNDTLVGGAGKDILIGGPGYDIFDFNSYAEMGYTTSTRDVIKDFLRGVDKIDLSTLDANPSTSANNAFTFIHATSLFSNPGQIKFAGEVLYGNTDYDSTPEFAIKLLGIISLTSSDVIL